MLRQYYQNFTVTDYLTDPVPENIRFDCGLGTNPFLDDQIIQDCLNQASWSINTYSFARYDRLKRRLLDYWGTTGLNHSNLALGAGSFSLMRDICGFALDRGGLTLGYAPQFPRIESEVWMRQANYVPIYMSGATDDPQQLPPFKFDVKSFLTSWPDQVNLVYLDNPNNPTGQIISLADIEAVTARAQQAGAITLVDEAYGDYMEPEESAINLVRRFDNLVVTRSASKFWGLPNHRIGYAFAAPALVEILEKTSNPFPFSEFSAAVFIALLDRADDMIGSKLATRQAKTQAIAQLDGLAHTSDKTPIMVLPVAANILDNHGIHAETCTIVHGLGPGYSRVRLHRDTTALISELRHLI